MLGVLLIAVGLNVVHRRNFAEYVGRRAVLARLVFVYDLITSTDTAGDVIANCNVHINVQGAKRTL